MQGGKRRGGRPRTDIADGATDLDWRLVGETGGSNCSEAVVGRALVEGGGGPIHAWCRWRATHGAEKLLVAK
jgi:hypothetical protein